jgi:hypothetical protein
MIVLLIPSTLKAQTNKSETPADYKQFPKTFVAILHT